MKPGNTNEEDRLNFIKFWVNYIKNHSDQDWSRQQNIIINSQLQSSKNIEWTNEQFEALRKLKIKEKSF